MLLNLIRGAKATLFPSIYEGFGLPILESMALNTPVLTSKGGATGEVAGDAAVLVAPYDIDSLAAGIRALDADADLRNELSLRGKDRARIFSPEAYEARLDTLYSRVT
jgi:glycosyltransferase involved in cell wall biosynthesis